MDEDKLMAKNQKKIVMTACMGQDVHIGGIYNFMDVANRWVTNVYF